MGRIDFAHINESILGQYPNILEEWLPEGKVEGNEYKSTNPTRVDNSPGSFSININTGIWSDFATGDKGSDPISLYAYLNKLSQGDSAKELAKRNGNSAIPRKKNNSDNEVWTPIIPIPGTAPLPMKYHFKFGKPSRTWTYTDEFGNVVGYTHRFDLPNNEKEIWPQTFCSSNKGRKSWRWLSLPHPRPLYNLLRLIKNPDLQVFIVEGEKVVDSVQELSDGVVVVTWPNGGKSVRKTEWKYLKGRKCIVFPDADKAGVRTATEVHEEIKKIATPKYVQFPSGVKKGWDLDDAINEGWDFNKIVSYAKNNLLDDPKKLTLNGEKVNVEEKKERTEEEEERMFRGCPFQLLGHNRGNYYYHPKETKQVIEIPCERHSSKTLMMLAPMEWWNEYFMSKNGIDWYDAIDFVFRAQHKLGIYDPNKVRGCGAWIDKGRVIVHCGDHLDVDGKKKQVYDIDSEYIYEASIKKRINDDPPISTEESSKLLTICDSLCWEKPISGKLLAGWIVLAPLCGALNWRPHIQITGSAGSGKTWTVENIIKPVLGDIVVQVTGNTTEPGIRQKLKSNAFPMLFDEAEGESRRARIRLQDILDLMRLSSSESSATIAKGTRTGTGIDFKIRSSFCIASIGVPMTQQADVSRVSVLTLKVNTSMNRIEEFENIKRLVRTTISPLWSSGLRGRSIKMIKTILKNIEVFSKAASEVLGTQRAGDQVGSLLGGAWSLKYDTVCTQDIASKFVIEQNWEDYQTENLDTDEYRCISRILQKPVNIKTSSRSIDVSVSELVEQLLEDDPSNYSMGDSPWTNKWSTTYEEAEKVLKRIGIKATKEKDMLLISDSNSIIQKYMDESPWATNWGKILRRIPGSEKRQSERFNLGVRQRATAIPVEWLKKAGKEE